MRRWREYSAGRRGALSLGCAVLVGVALVLAMGRWAAAQGSPGSAAAPRLPAEGAAALEPPRPFGQGTYSLGVALGISAGAETAFGLGGSAGYFVLPGVEPGLSVDVTFGSAVPTVTTVVPYLRWVFWRSYSISPYLKGQVGRLFVTGAEDLTLVGGGGGLVTFVAPRLGLQLEAVVNRYLPGETCGDDCTALNLGLSLGVYL